MNCAKCGAQITDADGQCPNCLARTSRSKEIPARPRYYKPMIIGMIALAVLGIIALVIALALQGRQTDITYAPPLPGSGDSVLGARPSAQPQENLLGSSAGNTGTGGLLQAPEPNPLPDQRTPGAVVKPKPPQYVLDYLAFVKGIEEHRQKLLKDTQDAFAIAAVAQATGGLDAMLSMLEDENAAQTKDPLHDANAELARQYNNWYSTLAYFNKRQPPEECKDFAAYYQQVLYTETQSIGQVVSITSGAGNSNTDQSKQVVAGLKGMLKGNVQKQIDTAVEYADKSLDYLVANYDMQKPFTVAKEQDSGGNLLGF